MVSIAFNVEIFSRDFVTEFLRKFASFVFPLYEFFLLFTSRLIGFVCRILPSRHTNLRSPLKTSLGIKPKANRLVLCTYLPFRVLLGMWAELYYNVFETKSGQNGPTIRVGFEYCFMYREFNFVLLGMV